MQTLCEAFAATVAARPDRPALRTADGAIDWTWREYAERVSAAAAGLAGLGVGRCDTVALWLSNRPEFHVADTAAMHLGAAAFSVSSRFTRAQAEHVIGDAGSRILITEPALIERALEVKELTALERIVLVEGRHPQALTWVELLAAAPEDFDVGERAYPDDLLTLIYTSDTTGLPTGVELTHVNVRAQVQALTEALRLPAGLRAISWLPMAHIAERLCTHYLPLVHGWSVTCLDEPREIVSLMGEVRPEFFFSPPRLWEKLRDTLEDAAEPLRTVGLDAARVALVGAAPCPAEVVEFWHGLGLPLSEIHGMAETAGVATVTPPGAMRAGTLGTPLPGIELRPSEDGRILIRGDTIMRGYRNRLDAGVIDVDGWLQAREGALIR
jgi:long-subunit acyl-CoA synthetase (AMP-forming)